MGEMLLIISVSTFATHVPYVDMFNIGYITFISILVLYIPVVPETYSLTPSICSINTC